MNLIKQFINDESGATAIEYGLIAALLAIGIIAAVTNLRNELSATFDRVGTELSSAPTGPGS